jgi:hypothetical protein
MNRLAYFSRPFKVLLKRILSYTNSNWNLNNYPIEFREQKMLDLSNTNLKMFPWQARIINWYWMSGNGNTRREAFFELKENFEKYKLEKKSLPRPGNKVEIISASTLKVDALELEAIHFFEKIFDMDYMGIFISDFSSLYDICWTDESILIAKEKINKNYRKMANTFCLINNITGELYFDQDKIENEVISDRMRIIYDEYKKQFPLNSENEKMLSAETFHLYQILDIVLKNLDNNIFTKRIE